VLQARVVDELGLAAESDPVAVTVSLQMPAAPLAAASGGGASASWPLLAVAGLGLLLAVGAGGMAWWWVARRQSLAAVPEGQSPVVRVPFITRPAGRAPANGQGAPAPVPEEDTAPYQPVRRPRPAGARPHLSLPALHWPGRPAHPGPHSPAYLEYVEASGSPSPAPPIELNHDSLTLGRDPASSDVTFADRSVSRLHARIERQGDAFHLYDEGSTSGTWVNYSLITLEAGCELRHGDLVNLGRVQLRFQQRGAPAAGSNGARVVKVAAPAQPPAAPPPANEAPQ
jgi:hypothetical protein